MDDLIAFMRARLDEWERLARQALPLQTGSRDEGQSSEHVSWRRSAGHPEFALRHVTTLRAIVNNYESCATADRCSTEPTPIDHFQDGLGWVLKRLAADFSTHPDYRPEWAPER